MTTPRSVQFLRDYVAIPSVNPMGRSDVPDDVAGEERYAEHLREQLRRLGLDAEVIGSGSRRSVVAEAIARDATDTLLVASHLDTVPVDGMEIDPFDPAIHDGRLYGRGSCDTKGGMAALTDALQHVLERGTLRRNVIVVGEADEELGSLGVDDVLQHLGGRDPGVDWVLATEPTSLRVVTAHKGIAIARVEVGGRACHSSDPSQGSNAVVAMARAVLALDSLASDLGEARADPLLGTATLSVGLAGGGQAPNIVPDEAWLVAERRLLPGEDGALARREIEAALARHAVSTASVVSCETMKPPLGTATDHPAVRGCLAALADAGLPAETGTVAFGTDAGVFEGHGIPGVVMGPGSIDQAHTSREYVPVDEVASMAAFFVRLLESSGR